MLVGENGAGKTTVLNLLYYLLSGQWNSMAKYQFEEISIRIGGKDHRLRFSDLEKSLIKIDKRNLLRLPASLRQRVTNLLDRAEGHLIPAELERICIDYGIPLELLMRDLSEGPLVTTGRHREQLPDALVGIMERLDAQYPPPTEFCSSRAAHASLNRFARS